MKKISCCNNGCETFLNDFDFDIDVDVDVTVDDFESQIIKARRRNRRKKAVAHDKRLEKRAEDAVISFSKRWKEACRHCYTDDFKIDNTHHIAKKCKFMGNKVVNDYFGL